MIAARSIIPRRTRAIGPLKSKWWFRPVADTRMEKVNQFAFYEFGCWMERLRAIQADTTWSDAFMILLNTEKAIDSFLEAATHVPLKLSRRSLEIIKTEVDRLSRIPWNAESVSWEDPVTESEIEAVHQHLNSFETVFASESQELEVFSIPQKLAYSTITLIEHGEQVLPESIRQSLSDFTNNEIRQGAACIVFDLPTAAGFHLLRGLESSVREFYDKITSGAPRPVNKHGNDVALGDYIVEIEKTNKVDASITETLRQIKRLHRDRQMHPDMVLKDGEDVILLGIVTSAIWAMFK